MKLFTLIIFTVAILFTGCVQKTYKKTVVFELNTAGMGDVKTAGIRGKDKPLSWDYDLEMTATKKDSLYTATFTGVTGYRFTQVKFVVNGEFELQNESNRRVVFAEGDTTFYKATFNKK